MCYVDHGDRCDVWTETTPRARRPYTCAQCGLAIRQGDRHTKIASLFDGRWTTTRVHSDCWALSQYIQLDVCQQEVVFAEGDLRHEVREHMRESPEVLWRYRDVMRARRAEGVWPGGGQ